MIIGITGPVCAGTDSFGKILQDKGFIWFSCSDILREELKKNNIEITRKNLQDYGDKMRREEGMGVLSKIFISKMEPEKDYATGNIRNPGEVDELRKLKDFYLVHINASRMIRYDRMLKRNRENDPKTMEEFIELERRDFGIDEPEYGQRHGDVFKMADKKIFNNGSLNDLEKEAEMFLEDIGYTG